MKKFTVLGAGLMGKIAAKDILDYEKDVNVLLIDNNESVLSSSAEFINDPRLKTFVEDIRDTKSICELIAGTDVVVGALPHRYLIKGFEAVIEAKVPYVDMILEEPEKQFQFNDPAKKADIIIIPGLGVAPGISNICVGRANETLDELNVVKIFVGGIPKQKTHPLEYQTVYTLETLFDTYTREVRLFRNKKEVIEAPLSDLETIEFNEPIGKLEAFNTNGLASLIKTMGNKVTDLLVEKTLRYPGHADKIKFLSDCGMLVDRPVKIGKCEVIPLDLVIHQLSPLLTLGPDGDILVMRIYVKGKKDNKTEIHTFELVDYFDRKTNFTAMARTTAFPAACAARMISNGMIKEKGVKFPEEIFIGENYDFFIRVMKDHNINIRHVIN